MSKNIVHDFGSSIVVFLVALPLCMGIALASGLSPAAGLLTGIIGGIFVGLLTGCPLQVSGPAAGLIAAVWAACEQFGVKNLGPIVMAAGFIQALIGLFGFASWFRAVSPAVIQGGLSGLGILIAGSQIHVMLDTMPKKSGIENLLAIPETVYKGLFPFDGNTHHLAACVGLITIATVLAWILLPIRHTKIIPAPLIGVLVAIAVTQFLNFNIKHVNVPTNILNAIHLISFENLQILKNPNSWIFVLSIAFVGTIETVLTMIAIERMAPKSKVLFNRELVAQGMGNILCGALGILPLAGVIIRSAANINTGGKTRLSTILHGIWMLIPILCFPKLLAVIPTAALAALLVYTGCRLVNLNSIKVLRAYGKSEVLIFLITLLTTVAFNLLTGILFGIALAIINLIYNFTHLKVNQYRSNDGEIFFIQFEGKATFLGLPFIFKTLSSHKHEPQIVVDCRQLTYMDHACEEFFENWKNTHKNTIIYYPEYQTKKLAMA